MERRGDVGTPDPGLGRAWPPPLTDREHQVLRELAAGSTTSRIAADLAISPLTVRSHLTAIMDKLEVRSAAEAVSAGVRLGIVDGGREAVGPPGTTGALGAMARRARDASRVDVVVTARERQVLRGIADGKTTRQIAMLLGISERTTRSHISGLYAKLEVGSRVEAVATGTRLGLLGDA